MAGDPSAVLATRKPTRRDRRRNELHQRLLAAAVALFDEKGPGDTTVDEICQRADVAQKTFFNHFPTKQHLLREIAAAFLAEMGELVEEARAQPGSTARRLEWLFRRVAEESEQAGPMHRELILQVVRVAQLEDTGPAHAHHLHEAFGALLRDGVAAGDVTRAHGPAFLTEMAVVVFLAIMMNWVGREDYPLEQELGEAARFLSRALAVEADPRGAAREEVQP